jgi:hypothetical protein
MTAEAQFLVEKLVDLYTKLRLIMIERHFRRTKRAIGHSGPYTQLFSTFGMLSDRIASIGMKNSKNEAI